MKRSIQTLLLLLAIMLAQPRVALSCEGAYSHEGRVRGDDGKGYYELGETRYTHDEWREYLFQRWPNIVRAEVSSITDASGKNAGDYRPWKRPDDRKEIPELPVIYHWKVTKHYKGKSWNYFLSVRPSHGMTSCQKQVVLNREYLLYLPELPETGVFRHFDILSLTYAPLFDVSDAGEWLEWLDERVHNWHEVPGASQKLEFHTP